MGDRKQFHPFWYVIFDLTHRKFIKNLFQDPEHIFFSKLFTVYPEYRCLIFFFQFSYQLLCLFPVRLFRIHKNQKWFPLFFEFLYCLFFSIHKIFTRNITEGTVAGYYETDGRMFLDHFSGSNLCRLMKRNLLFIPGGFYHSFFFLLHIPCSFRHHKSHAVDQSDLHRNLFSQIYIHRFPGNKFGFHCCNCFS